MLQAEFHRNMLVQLYLKSLTVDALSQPGIVCGQRVANLDIISYIIIRANTLEAINPHPIGRDCHLDQLAAEDLGPPVREYRPRLITQMILQKRSHV